MLSTPVHNVWYLPFLSGAYSVAPGLIPMQKAANEFDKKIFQFDENYKAYHQNKQDCRAENIYKYYLEKDLLPQTGMRVNHYIVQQLLMEYPSVFSVSATNEKSCLTNHLTAETVCWQTTTQALLTGDYLSLFDALCSQVPEDVAVCQLENDRDWLAAIHLCSPNHWSPEEKIGLPFNAIHAPVPGMQKTFANSSKMLQSLVEKGPFTRFAWGIASDTRLNHHPQPPRGISSADWQGRNLESGVDLFIRTERQNLVGFPDVNAFLFTIRTYFYPVKNLNRDEMNALIKAIDSMSPEALAYKGMSKTNTILKALL